MRSAAIVVALSCLLAPIASPDDRWEARRRSSVKLREIASADNLVSIGAKCVER